MSEDLRNMDAIEFKKSAQSSVGIEWELQLIDADSFNLRQNAAHVVAAVQEPDPANPLVHREMLLNTVELVSHPHSRVNHCVADLKSGIELLRPVLQPMRIALGSAGTHPFAVPKQQMVTPSPRYDELVNRTQYWGRQMLLFGTHVHVGIDSPAKVFPILSALLTWHGHLQALTAASPIWDGELTGYASNRAMVFQQLPTSGLPQQFEDWSQLQTYVRGMKRTGVVDDFTEIRWDIRPAPRLGTVEVRVCDAATNIAEVGMAAALCQCLVEYYSRKFDAGEELPKLPDWFVAENKWRAARYGLEAILIDDAEGERETLVIDTLRDLVAELQPIAVELGCAKELLLVNEVLEIGAPYQRQLSVYERTGKRREVVKHMLAEMEAGRPLPA